MPARAKAKVTAARKSAVAAPAIGAHCNGGMKGSVKKALEIGAEAIQIFIGSPQSWRTAVPLPEEFKQFKQAVQENRLGPVFVHGNYLVNLAADIPGNYSKSIDNMSLALRLADAAGAAGLIFHPGSAKTASYKDALKKVVKALERVLDGYSGNCKVLLEVCAGQGETIGDRFSELSDIMSALGDDEILGVCWDTCHMYSAGYDIATAAGLKKTMEEFEREVGFDRLYAIHANDSKTPLGSRRDRHENIGKGQIGTAAFGRMLQEPRLRRVPWILEVPGKGEGPDRENIDLLRSLASKR